MKMLLRVKRLIQICMGTKYQPIRATFYEENENYCSFLDDGIFNLVDTDDVIGPTSVKVDLVL